MEGVRVLWEDLENTLRMQIQLMDEFAELQLEVRRCLESRDWPQLERTLQEMESKGRELQNIEETRQQLWEKNCHEVHAETDDSFYSVTLRLPDDQRTRLSELRQTLRLSTLNLKGVNHGLSLYVQSAGLLIKAYLKEIRPELKGSLYGRAGKLRNGESVSMVLNRHI